MKNNDVRRYAEARNVKLWQIAEALQINDGNLSRRLRKELSAEKKQEIFAIIDKLAQKEDT